MHQDHQRWTGGREVRDQRAADRQVRRRAGRKGWAEDARTPFYIFCCCTFTERMEAFLRAILLCYDTVVQ